MKSTAAQRTYIAKLAGSRKMSELETILAPALRINGDKFNVYDTLTQPPNRESNFVMSKVMTSQRRTSQNSHLVDVPPQAPETSDCIGS